VKGGDFIVLNGGGEVTLRPSKLVGGAFGARPSIGLAKASCWCPSSVGAQAVIAPVYEHPGRASGESRFTGGQAALTGVRPFRVAVLAIRRRGSLSSTSGEAFSSFSDNLLCAGFANLSLFDLHQHDDRATKGLPFGHGFRPHVLTILANIVRRNFHIAEIAEKFLHLHLSIEAMVAATTLLGV
jgi:hypothetical protein